MRGFGRRKIDHIAVLARHEDYKLPRILTRIGVSDHYPVVGEIRCGMKNPNDGGSPPDGPTTDDLPQIDTRSIPIVGGPGDYGTRALLRKQVATSNSWTPLLSLASTDVGSYLQEAYDTAADSWDKAYRSAAAANGLTRKPGIQNPKGRKPMNQLLAMSIDKQEGLHAKARHTKPGTPECTAAWEAHKEQVERVRANSKKENARLAVKQLNFAASRLRRDPAGYWRL